MDSKMKPFLLYGHFTTEGVRCIEEQCVFLHNLHQLTIPSFVARKVENNSGFILVPYADIEYLRRLLR